MERSIRAAHRAAVAAPEEEARRVAYARALLRAGHRVCAAFEFAAGHAPAPPELVFRDRDGGEWTVRCADALFDGVAPPGLPDARVRGAAVERGAQAIPLVLLAVVCGDCVNGGRACHDCNGRGTDRPHFLDSAPSECPECRGLGAFLCASCGGNAILADRIAPTSPCGHDALDPEPDAGDVLPWSPWRLLRCRECGLAVLDLEDGTRRAACPACGLFGCDGAACANPRAGSSTTPARRPPPPSEPGGSGV